MRRDWKVEWLMCIGEARVSSGKDVETSEEAAREAV